MDGTVKVHRKQRQKRQNDLNSNNNNSNSNSHNSSNNSKIKLSENKDDETVFCADDEQPTTSKVAIAAQQQPNERVQVHSTATEELPQTQTVLLVNGETAIEEPTTPDQTTIIIESSINKGLDFHGETVESCKNATEGGSSRNSSGDAMSLRETLKQLPAPALTTLHHHHRSRHSRTHSVSPHSPQSPMRYRCAETIAGADGSMSGSSCSLQQQRNVVNAGIHGFLERELKHSSPTSSGLSVNGRKLQTLSDPTGSPAPTSLRSRTSLERSPRRKRSKSESRRRRERKLIAAGEMEVRQANETLMRYLKQCSEMNDASLSGELEIDQNYDERRVQRKTKSQRDKRGHLMNKLVSAGGLTSILKELSDDIVPADGEEIYNPFTPVISPTEEDAPAQIDKVFMQTSSGYRQLEKYYYRHNHNHHHHHHHGHGHGPGGLSAENSIADGNASSGCLNNSLDLRGGESRCLLDGDCRRHKINSNIQLACVVQRIWLLISNICHGLLAGLALSHLLFIVTSHPMSWSQILNVLTASLNTEAQQVDNADESFVTSTATSNLMDQISGRVSPPTTLDNVSKYTVLEDYATFANFYLNTFYCLTIVCLISVLDRMDICRWELSNATEFISFRWLIITMIYIATIILTICSDSIDDKLYFHNMANVTLTQQELLINRLLSIWSSLSVTRSIGAVCGWIMIGLAPHEDMLYAHLVDLTQYQMPQH